MIGFDLRKYGTLDLSFYLALEAYLINRNDDNDYFFLWDIDKSIIVGINQLVETEVNLDFVRKNDFKVYRRPSGGGAIYADSGDFMFTFLTNKKSKDEMFNYSLDKIRSVLSSLGLDVSKSGRNDLTYLDKKFSGSAIYYKNNKTILHGTFLYDASLDNLEKFLTPSSNKLISKGISSVKSRVINLKEYLNGMTKDELMKYFLYHIDEDIKVKNLDQEDFDKVMVIKNKYDDESFIYNNKPLYEYHNKKRFNFGEVEVYIDVYHNKIKDIRFYGDYFNDLELESYYELFKHQDIKDIFDIINCNDISKYIIGMDNNDLIDLIKEINYGSSR